MSVAPINDLYMEWREEKLGMERAIGQLLQYVALQQTQLQSHEERIQRLTAQVATLTKPKVPKPKKNHSNDNAQTVGHATARPEEHRRDVACYVSTHVVIEGYVKRVLRCQCIINVTKREKRKGINR